MDSLVTTTSVSSGPVSLCYTDYILIVTLWEQTVYMYVGE